MSAPCILQIGEFPGPTLPAVAQAHQLQFSVAPTLASAVPILTSSNVALAFVAPGQNLADVFRTLRENKLTTRVVACGPAHPTSHAVKAIRQGAVEYLTLPLEAKLVASLCTKVQPLQPGKQRPIAGDAQTQSLLQQAEQFAQSDATVLLRGESGTGKEVFSTFIHEYSPRRNGPFVAVNCAAIPEALLESELFGHEKGAFSGAIQRRIGKFQQADGGTLLLDEISEMDLPLQAKLLRAIQEKVIDPVGSDKPVPVNIRLIATTNRKLEDYVAEGQFREDLYFRLSVVMLEIPALRDRPGDIAPLADFFVHKYAQQNGKLGLTLSAAGLEKLESCYWKGNVRELENTIHRAVIMAGNSTEIQPAHITLSPMSLQMMSIAENNAQAAQSADVIVQPRTAMAAGYGPQTSFHSGSHSGFTPAFAPTAHAGQSLADIERQHILSTLTYCRGNREIAADVLGISLQILKQKLEAYDAA